MSIEEKLKELIIKKFGSVNKFAQACGLSTSTVATIFSRGVNKTNISTIIKICQQLEISADALAEGEIVSKLSDDKMNKYKTMLFNGDITKLNEPNQARLMSYYLGLLDSQEDENNGNT